MNTCFPFVRTYAPKAPVKMFVVLSFLSMKRRHAVAADKNCIPINTHESRFSKKIVRIKSKNMSFGSLFKAQDS